jgi:DMSO/TMAO reductase YedYZ molybdopterin-dependent catalytic subunit
MMETPLATSDGSLNRLQKVGFWPAVLSGGLLTAPLTGLLYLADKLAGLPFTPFALFDWIAKVLPGVAVTFGIDMMIEGLRLFGMSVAASAKTAEQIVAVLLFFVIGVALSAAFLCVMKIREAGPRPAAGLALGLIFGIPMVAVSLPMGQSTVDPVLTAVVLAVLFLLWGLGFMPMYDKLLLSADGLPTEDRIRWAKSINRRQFLVGVGAATATVTVLSVGIGGVLARSERRQVAETVATSMAPASTETKPPLPNADDPVAPAPGTRPEYTQVKDHYKVFLRSEPSIIDGSTWSLPITGLVDNPLTLTLDDFHNDYESRDQYVTLSCISGRIATTLISTTLWTGISLQKILSDLQVRSEARYLVIESADGFHETVDLNLIASDERIMLAYAWDGRPIPMDHGFPLRIWLPDRYGMKQPKWITSMEITDEYQPGYWVDRGWDEVAQVQATSVIDTVATDDIVDQEGQLLIPIGGIAFSGARGISRVEVQVNNGPWEEAQLRTPLSETTWVLWRYDWPFQKGKHTFAVRCAEADGTPQIEESRGNRPSGATGIHRRRTSV